MKLFKEYAKDTCLRYGDMKPARACFQDGYCSLYYFFEDAAKEIKKQKNSRKLDRFPVWTNRLVMDYDDGDRTFWDDLPKIIDMGAPFRVYFSGGKGYHVEIHVNDMSGVNVPYSQRVFVKEMGFKVDESLYQHGRIISNIGRIHPKTKQPKKLLFEFLQGEPITIPEAVPPKLDLAPVERSDLMFKQAVSRLHRLNLRTPGIGMRHTSIWGTAKDFRNGGLSLESTLEIMQLLNAGWPDPKTDDEVEAAVLQAYDARAGVI